MRVAKDWGIVPPTDFYRYPKIDRAIMIQTWLDENGMAAYEAELQKQKHNESFRNLGGSGTRGRAG